MNKTIQKLSLEELKKYYYNQKLDVLHDIKTYCDQQYYNSDNKNGISDIKYDLLIDIISEKESKDYVIPVGVKVSDVNNQTKLPYYLGSMNKYKSEKDVNKWIEKYKSSNYVIQDKLDGVSALLVDNSVLYTRGDGEVGSDISYLLPYINNIPKKYNSLVIRGELIFNKSVFETKYKSSYANARNLISGVVNSKIIKEEIRDVDFIAYEIIYPIEIKTEEQLNILKKYNYKTVDHTIYDYIDINILSEYLIKRKHESEYEIDGIIVHTNSKYNRNTSSNPEYAFAYKITFDDNLIDAEVIDVEWNTTKWNVLKPRIKIKPVNLCGVTIQYTTGFNAKYIQENNIGKGTIIKITRSGDIIPYIIEVVKPTIADLPKTGYIWNDSKVDIISSEEEDITSKIKTISSFFSELKIKHVSDATILKLFNNGYDTLEKILLATKEDFMKIETFQEKLAERTYNNIHNGLKNKSIDVLLGASSVFGYGMGKRKIAKLLEDVPNLFELNIDEMRTEIMKVEGFSSKSAEKIINNIPNAINFIKCIDPYITPRQPPQPSTSTERTLNGVTILFSGFRDAKLEEDIVSQGGKVTTSISKNTNYLIVKSKTDTSSKITKALELNIPILTKEEFLFSMS